MSLPSARTLSDMRGQHTLGLGSALSGARRVQSVIDPYVLYRADSTT